MTNQNDYSISKSKEQNNGGFFGGVGYVAEKAATGVVQGIEGIWDFVAGGLADFFGADEWAEEQFSTNWFGDWYSHPDEWYNPGETMKFVGDIASGIGSSVPTLATAAAAGAVSGGTAAPMFLAGLVGGTSAAGSATSEAFRETGKLDSDAYLYGAAVGTTEGVLEYVTGALGTGIGKVAKTFAKQTGKEIGEAASKSVIKELGKEFLSEGFEEGFSELVSPFYKRLTYDPDAELASIGDITYSAIVGGFSGAITSGGVGIYSKVHDSARGTKILSEGKDKGILETSRLFVEKEGENASGDSVREFITKTYNELNESLKTTDNKITTVKQKVQLAELERANSAAVLTPFIYKSAAQIVSNPTAIADRLNSYGYKNADGSPITFTVEQITKDVDLSNPKSLAKALQTNEVLRNLAVSDAMGKLMMNTSQFKNATLEGKNYATADDLTRFAENADSETFKQVSEALGITADEWYTMTPDLFTEKMNAYKNSEQGAQVIAQSEKIKAAKKIPESEAKTKIPLTVKSQRNGTIKRYKTENADFAVIKENDTYTVYNYQTNKATVRMSLAQTQSMLEKLKGEGVEKQTNRYAIKINANNEPFVVVDRDILDGVDKSNWIKVVKQNLIEKFPNGVELGDNVINIDRQSRKELTFSKYTQRVKVKDAQKYSDKLRATNNADEIIYATLDWKSEKPNHTRRDNIVSFDRGSVLLSIGKNDYSASVIVGEKKDGKMLLYDIVDLTPLNDKRKETIDVIPVNSSRRAERKASTISSNSILKTEEKINPFEEKNQKNISSQSKSTESTTQNTESETKDTYTVYDYKANKATVRMSLAQTQSMLEELRLGDGVASVKNVDVGSQIIKSDEGYIVEINLNSSVQKELSAATPKERGKIVERELRQSIKIDNNYTFHDGIVAVLDGGDISKITHTKHEPKTRATVSMKHLVDVAKIYAVDEKIDHPKFEKFRYYKSIIKIGELKYECILNVGLGRYDQQYHIYDVNQFEQIAENGKTKGSGSPILSNPRKSVDQTVSRTPTSTNSILKTNEKINPFEEKNQKNISSQSKSTESTTQNTESETKISKEYRRADIFAKENVPEYSSLYDAQKRAVRRTIVEGRANGLTDEDLRTFARFSAKTGINLAFDKSKLITGRDKQGNIEYADGMYDGDNTIIINKDSKRKYSSVIFHEMMHYFYKNPGDKEQIKLTKKLLKTAIKKMDAGRLDEIRTKYLDFYTDGGKNDIDMLQFNDILLDEIAAHYAEDVFTDVDVLEFLESENPGMIRKIISFFYKSAQRHSEEQILARASRSYIRSFKQLANSLEERNKNGNALTRINSQKMQDTEETKETGNKNSKIMQYRFAVDKDLLNFIDSVSNMENKKNISKRNHKIGKISSNHAKLVKSLLLSELGINIDLNEYTININGSAIMHIAERHGVNGVADHSMKNKEDVARLGWAVNNAEYGHVARTKLGTIDYSSAYKNADGTPSPKIILEKILGDGKIIVVECIPDALSKKIYIISARKIKDGNGQVLNMKPNDSPQPTSETLLDGITATNSISENSKKINSIDKNSSEKRFAIAKESVTISKKALSETASKENKTIDKNAEKEYNGTDDNGEDSNPVYDVYDDWKEILSGYKNVDPTQGIKRAQNEYKVTPEEASSLKLYVRGVAYNLTRMQREDADLNEYEKYLVENIKSGLLKHPVYVGKTYRNLDFGSVYDTENTYKKFIDEHYVGAEITVNAFTSASKIPNGYPVAGKMIVHLVIDGVSARDISDTFNPGQSEVIYLPGAKYKVTKVITANDGNPLIYAEEIATNEIQKLSRSVESAELPGSVPGVLEGYRNDGRGVRSFRRGDDRSERISEREVHSSSQYDTQRGENIDREIKGKRYALNTTSDDKVTKQQDSASEYDYTENQYNRFGWAREAKALSKSELDDLCSKIQSRKTLLTFKRSSNHESIIEVNDKPHTTLDVNNVFVFVKGTKDNFYINRVVRFEAQTETEMEIIKEDLYEGRTCSDTHLAFYKKQGIAREYRRENFPTFAEYRGKRSNGTTSRRTHQDNRGSEQYRSGYSLVVGEDGEVISEKRYALNTTSDDKVTISKGELQKRRANFTSDRVYNRSDVESSLRSIETFNLLPKDVKTRYINQIWQGLNGQLYHDARKQYVELITNSMMKDLRERAGTDESFKNIKTDGLEGDHIKESILDAFNILLEKGKQSIKFKIENAEGSKTRNELINSLMHQTQMMKDLKLGTYSNMTQAPTDNFNKTIGALTRINYQGNLNVTGTRRILGDLAKWYSEDNPILNPRGDKDGGNRDNGGYYDKDIADTLSRLASVTGELTVDELRELNDIFSYFRHFVETYAKVYRDGQWVEALPLATEYVKRMKEIEGTHPLAARRLLNTYAENFGDPESVVRMMDRYTDGGFFTDMFEQIRKAVLGANLKEASIKKEYNEFLNNNKKYVKTVANETVKFHDVEVPKLKLIGLYMTLKREHSHEGYLYNGFSFLDPKTKKKVHVDGILTRSESNENLDPLKILDYVKGEQKALEKLLSDTDKKYIEILEKIYNNDSKELKSKRDLQRFGTSNVVDKYYYPIRRAGRYKSIDSTDIAEEIDHIKNSSFNKNTVEGAAQELYIEDADIVFNRHLKAVCQYYYLTPVVEMYDRIYNLDTGNNRNKPISVASVSENVWAGGNKYLKALIADAQGIPRTTDKSAVLDTFEGVRQNYVKFQLYGNFKVIASQFSSIPASLSQLDVDCVLKSFTKLAPDIDDFSELAAYRNADNTAFKAAGVLDKIGGISEFFGKGISGMDRFVIKRLFVASQYQIEKNGGAKVGTEENKIAAGKLLEDVILKTQQNTFVTERSDAMRSSNVIMRTATLFSADSMKVLGRFVDAGGELLTLKSRKRMLEKEGKSVGNLNKKIKECNIRVMRSASAMVLSAIWMAVLAEAFMWFYNRDEDEDRSFLERSTVNVVGNMLGGLPFVRDLYSRFTEGYEMETLTYSALNDIANSAVTVFNLIPGIVTGEKSSKEVARNIKSIINVLGQSTGIPTRNLYNLFYGTTNLLSPNTAYRIDGIFYEQNYKNDLMEAIEKDDVDKASMLLSLFYRERVEEDISEELHTELYRLLSEGYNVIPKSIPDTVTIDEVEYSLSDEQYEAFRAEYIKYESTIESLLKRNDYVSLSAEEQAEAIKYAYELHYDSSMTKVFGIEKSKRSKLISYVDPAAVVMFKMVTCDLESDKDSDGESIAGTKRLKVINALRKLNLSKGEFLILLRSGGYAIKDGDIRGMSADRAEDYLLRYIMSLKNLTRDQKAELAELCGFTVKNGRVILNAS